VVVIRNTTASPTVIKVVMRNTKPILQVKDVVVRNTIAHPTGIRGSDA